MDENRGYRSMPTCVIVYSCNLLIVITNANSIRNRLILKKNGSFSKKRINEMNKMKAFYPTSGLANKKLLV
jgi:hypothetical protein